MVISGFPYFIEELSEVRTNRDVASSMHGHGSWG
jgi:hypothetical protein